MLILNFLLLIRHEIESKMKDRYQSSHPLKYQDDMKQNFILQSLLVIIFGNEEVDVYISLE
jgi:hypothetical protein